MQPDFSISLVGEPARTQPFRPTTENVKPGETKKQIVSEVSPGDKNADDKNKIDSAEKLAELQKSFAAHDIQLKFSRDEKTKTLVVEMIDGQTGEAVRKIPNDVSLKLAAEIGKLQGNIINRTA